MRVKQLDVSIPVSIHGEPRPRLHHSPLFVQRVADVVLMSSFLVFMGCISGVWIVVSLCLKWLLITTGGPDTFRPSERNDYAWGHPQLFRGGSELFCQKCAVGIWGFLIRHNPAVVCSRPRSFPSCSC